MRLMRKAYNMGKNFQNGSSVKSGNTSSFASDTSRTPQYGSSRDKNDSPDLMNFSAATWGGGSSTPSSVGNFPGSSSRLPDECSARATIRIYSTTRGCTPSPPASHVARARQDVV